MKKHLTIEQATHALIMLFTATSCANVQAFLLGAGHDWTPALLLSIALGASLAIIALALTKIDHTTEPHTFGALLAVGLGLGLLSGALQASEYSKHLAAGWAVGLGFGVPLLGEIGLSLASALFSRSQHRAELRSVNAKIEQAITANLDQAIADFDPTTIQKRIDKTLNRVALAAVGGVESNLMALYEAPGVQTVITETVDTTHNVHSPEALSQARTNKKQARMEHFKQLADGTRSPAEVAGLLKVTTKTVSRYADALRIPINGVVG